MVKGDRRHRLDPGNRDEVLPAMRTVDYLVPPAILKGILRTGRPVCIRALRQPENAGMEQYQRVGMATCEDVHDGFAIHHLHVHRGGVSLPVPGKTRGQQGLSWYRRIVRS